MKGVLSLEILAGDLEGLEGPEGPEELSEALVF